MKATAITDYFSSDYFEAREKFLNASRSSGLPVESYRNPNSIPGDKLLFTDVVLIGPRDAKEFIVLGSGTHGVEGFSGSAIQTGLLSEVLFSKLKPGVSILLIHAINPYGFAYLRRGNEDNIDLNRNFTDFSKSYPDNLGYEELAETICPESISFTANLKSLFKFLQYRILNGKRVFKEAISTGQYTHPKGLFYGGTNETWSNKTIRHIIERYLSNAERMIYIDFHTGLGPYGTSQVILHERENSPAYKRAVDRWGDKVQNAITGNAVTVYIPSSLKSVFNDILPETEITAVTLEFGTFFSLKVFWALRTENWLYHHGESNHPKTEKIKIDLLRAFYPDDEEWKLKVWNQGKEIVKQAIRKSS